MSQNGQYNKQQLRQAKTYRKHAHLTEHKGWQTEQLITDAKEYFTLLFEDISQAKHSVDLNFYIVRMDNLGKAIIDALIKARKRGVAVRLLMDGIGSNIDAKLIAQTLTDAGCEVKVFKPLPLATNLYRWSGEQGTKIQKLLHFLLNINQRNHYKLGIIDQTIIWSGSFNITDDHLPASIGGQGWRDYGVRLTDNNTQDIQYCFDKLWGRASRRPMLSRWHRFRTNLSLPMRRFYNKLMLFRIRYARQRIWICNAYFAPSHSVVRALIKARKNQVDVRLILPSVSDVLLFPTISQSYYAHLLRHGVKIYQYQNKILHAKVMLIDGHCWVGSTNLNHRSFYHDLELDIALEKPHTIQAVIKQLRCDMRQSELLKIDDYLRFSWPMMKAYFLRLFRYWM